MENVENIEKLLEAVRQIAFDIHVYLSNGYLEKVYENCLKHRLQKAGFDVETQVNLKVHDEDGFEIGDYFADMVVNKCLIVELKAAKTITAEHLSQTMNYLKATGYKLGLVINFGSYRFETRKVYPPTNIVHVERVEHGEWASASAATQPQSPSPTISPCSQCSPRTEPSSGIVHGERVDHGEASSSRAAPQSQSPSPTVSPCSQCSPRTEPPAGIVHVERVDHGEDSLACSATYPQSPSPTISPCSQCSPWTEPPAGIVHRERVDHGEGDFNREASPRSPCSPWTESSEPIVHGKGELHREASPCSQCSPWTEQSEPIVHGKGDLYREASPCSQCSPWKKTEAS